MLLRDIYYDIKYGVENLIKWFPLIYRDRDWDYVYLFEVIAFKLKRMEDLHRYEGQCVSSIKTANDIKTARLLMERLAKDEYYENAMIGKVHSVIYSIEGVTTGYEKAKKMKEQDLEYFCKVFRRKSLRWWD